MSKSRRSFTAEQKLEIIEYAEKHGNRAAERFFQVREKNIRDWRKIKPVISVMPGSKKSLRYSNLKVERSFNDNDDTDPLSIPSSSSNYYEHSGGVSGTGLSSSSSAASSSTAHHSHQQNHLKSYDSSIELLFQLKQQVDLLYKRLNYQNIFIKNSGKLHQYWKKNGSSIQLIQPNNIGGSMSSMLGNTGIDENGCIGGDGGGLGSIDMGLGSIDGFQPQLRNNNNSIDSDEFRTLQDRAGRSYRYWRKRSKELSKQTTSKDSDILYETIYQLYERLTIDYKSSLYDLLEGVCITENDIEVNLNDDGAGNLSSTAVAADNTAASHSLICPMESCQEKFQSKEKFLDHLMEHRNRGDSLIEKIRAQHQQQQPQKQRPRRMAAAAAVAVAAATKKKAAKKKPPPPVRKVPILKIKKIVPKRQASLKRVFDSEDDDDEDDDDDYDDDKDYKVKIPAPPKINHKVRIPPEPKPPKPAVNLECQIEGCNYVANCSAYLRRHHQWVHLKLRPHKCKECDKDFKTVYALKSHMNVHERKRYPCTEEGCSNHYSSSTAVVKHIKIFHKKISPILKCNWPDCNYSTPYQTSLSLHNNVHSGERPFKCIWPDCGKSFKAGSTLRDHLFVHKDERQFKCTWPGCGYSCNASNNLRKHESIHQRKKLKNQENFQPPQQQQQQQQQQSQQQQSQPQQQQQQATSLS